MLGLPFRQVWLLDTEFRVASRDHPDLPDLPEPVCLVARELNTDRLIRLWADDLSPGEPPFPIGDDILFVAYAAAAEWEAFLQLGWKLPTRVLDLHFEFLLKTNDGRPRAKGTTTLLAALADAHITTITSEQKTAERELVMRGGPWTDAERRQILDYCQTDVDPLGALLESMLPRIRAHRKGFGQAIIRGQHSVIMAHMARAGVPTDGYLNGLIGRYKADIRQDLIDQYDPQYGVYRNGSFKKGLFQAYLYDHKMDWPATLTGLPDLRDKTFKDMCGRYPQMENLRQLRKSLSQLSGKELFVGRDGRSRPFLAPFMTLTGRHNPSSSGFVFGRAPWMRGLVKPPAGRSLAYLDWRSQEVFIAAKLSGDKQLLDAVEHRDVYADLAVAAGLAPEGATKQSHPAERELAKTCFLAVGYGQQAPGLAMRTGLTQIEADNLIRSLRRMFPDFYEWSDHIVDVGQMFGYLTTVLGWVFQTDSPATEPNTIRNFLVQANGAEMCRLGCRYAIEAGVTVLCPMHDAFWIEADTDEIDDAVAAARAAATKASRIVLDGTEIEIELEHVVHGPNRLMLPKGAKMWDTVMDSLARHTGLPRCELEGRSEGRSGGRSEGT